MLLIYQESGELRSVVVDGVTIGHPCCGEHGCCRPLASARDHYCPSHAHLSSLCVVMSCNETAQNGFRTCSHPDHRKLETKYEMSSKAMFQLRRRYERSYPTPGTTNSGHVKDPDIEIEVVEDDCDGKSVDGNQHFRARFGRRRTHNDELCVASCGVILGRTTFYGSEAPSAIRVCFTNLSRHIQADSIPRIF